MLWHVMCTILSHRGGGGDGPRLECLLTLQDQHIGTQDRCQEELKYTITERPWENEIWLRLEGSGGLFQEKWILKQAVES